MFELPFILQPTAKPSIETFEVSLSPEFTNSVAVSKSRPSASSHLYLYVKKLKSGILIIFAASCVTVNIICSSVELSCVKVNTAVLTSSTPDSSTLISNELVFAVYVTKSECEILVDTE